MAKPVSKIILPGTDAWKEVTSAPLPPVGQDDQYQPPKRTRKPRKKPPLPGWQPDYSDPFYSFERRIVHLIAQTVSQKIGDVAQSTDYLVALADDGTVWTCGVDRRSWRQLPPLPRRMMKEPDPEALPKE